MAALSLRTNPDSATQSGPETRLQPRPALTTMRGYRTMANRADITPELCRQLLRYEPETGRLYWLPRPASMFRDSPCNGGIRTAQWAADCWNAKNAGKLADSTNRHGYRTTCLFKRQYPSHRLVIAMETGEMPPDEVDHINGDRADNRLANLRVVDKSENMRNQKLREDNSSGVCGVYWNKAANKWQAYIKIDGKVRYLGVFANIKDAAACRRKAEAEAGYHENHGKLRGASLCLS